MSIDLGRVSTSVAGRLFTSDRPCLIGKSSELVQGGHSLIDPLSALRHLTIRSRISEPRRRSPTVKGIQRNLALDFQSRPNMLIRFSLGLF